MKKGRVVILLAGRRAGKKAVIVKQADDGKKVSAHRQSLLRQCILTPLFYRARSSLTPSALASRDTPARSPSP